jgi:hypothetical protein
MFLAGCSNNGNGSLADALTPNPQTGEPPPAPPPPPPPPPPVAPEDVSGTWYVRIANNAVNCGLGEIVDAQTLLVVQDESDIAVLTSSGDAFSWTVNGDIIEGTGSYDERGGTTSYTTLSLVVSGDSASGNADWTWTDGTDSCNGTMAITASRNSGAVEETDFNSTPQIADPMQFTDGVAFITGLANSITDDDYFKLAPEFDAIIQVELSNFDSPPADLDLEILDVDLVRIAFSDSDGGFEKVEVRLNAGDTAYIGMVPGAAVSNAAYVLSIDVNPAAPE